GGATSPDRVDWTAALSVGVGPLGSVGAWDGAPGARVPSGRAGDAGAAEPIAGGGVGVSGTRVGTRATSGRLGCEDGTGFAGGRLTSTFSASSPRTSASTPSVTT